MKLAIQQWIRRRSLFVFNGLIASGAVTNTLGYRHAPLVKHDTDWRDRKTGHHSNDIESENGKFKQLIRTRHSNFDVAFYEVRPDEMVLHDDGDAEGPLAFEPFDPFEYVFYVNVGKAIPDIMQVQCHSTPQKKHVLRQSFA